MYSVKYMKTVNLLSDPTWSNAFQVLQTYSRPGSTFNPQISASSSTFEADFFKSYIEQTILPDSPMSRVGIFEITRVLEPKSYHGSLSSEFTEIWRLYIKTVPEIVDSLDNDWMKEHHSDLNDFLSRVPDFFEPLSRIANTVFPIIKDYEEN